MKSSILTIALSCIIILFSSLTVLPKKETVVLNMGDVVFINTSHNNASLLKKATHSKYNHCGLIILNGDGMMVLEAGKRSVLLTPLPDFMNKSTDGTMVQMTLKDRDKHIKDTSLKHFYKKAQDSALLYTTKKVDRFLSWDDNALYSSELVWKFYKNVFDIEICELQTLNDFDLKDPAVKEIMKEKYGSKIPLTEKSISPQKIYKSKLLKKVPRKIKYQYLED